MCALTFQPSLLCHKLEPSVCYLDIPNYSPSLCEVVNRGQPPSQVVGLLVRSGYRHAKSNALGGGSHGRNNYQRLIHRPLRARDDSGFEGFFVDIVSAFWDLARALFWGSELATNRERQQ